MTRAALLLATLCCALAAAGPAHAITFASPQTRLSAVGADGDPARDALFPAAAFDPVNRQYLVVFAADAGTDERYEIYGRFVTADGRPVGGMIGIGWAGGQGDATRSAYWPKVVYNSVRRQFLVVWVADNSATNDDFEIWARRLTPTGDWIGDQFVVSSMGQGSAEFNADQPQAVYNPQRDQYLVTWFGRDDSLPGRGTVDIWARRLAGDGSSIGGDTRIGDSFGDGAWPSVAYNARDGEYLVAYFAKSADGVQIPTIRRLDGDAVSVRPPQPLDTAGSHKVNVAWNADRNEYLVAWPRYLPGETEIFVKRVSAAGDPIGAATQISQMGPPNDGRSGAGVDVGMGYNPVAKQYLVTWVGDTNEPGFADNHFEVYGQALDGTGAEIGPQDVQISSSPPFASADVGVATRELLTSPLALDPVTGRALVVWPAGMLAPPLVAGEWEAHGRLIEPVPSPAPPPEPVVAAAPAPVVSAPPKVLPLLPRFRPRFIARAGTGKRKYGQIRGATGFRRMPRGTVVTLNCVRACRGRGRVVLTSSRARGRGSVKLRRWTLVRRKTIVEIRVTRAGYRGRWASYKFRRANGALIGIRIDQGCLPSAAPYRRVRCSG